MASHLLFATCPKTIPNGALLSKLATDSGTFKLLGKGGGTYILGHEDRYISVVDTDNSLSALHLSNKTTLKATRIVGKFNASRSFTVEFKVNDPSFEFINNVSVFTLTEEQFKVLGVDYTTQLNNDFIARRDCSTGQKRKTCADVDSTANPLDHVQKRQNVQETSLPLPPLPFLCFGISVPLNCDVPDPIIPDNHHRQLKILDYNASHESYTVSFMEPNKAKLTTEILTKTDLMKLPGGRYLIGDYTRFLFMQRKLNVPVTSSPVANNVPDTVFSTQIQSLCVLPPQVRDLQALSFQANLDTYLISYRVKSTGKKIEKQVTTLEMTNFPGGLAAIENYKKLYEPKHNKLPVPALVQAPAPCAAPYLAPTLPPPSVAAVQPHYSSIVLIDTHTDTRLYTNL
jgi:hypothetical protein